MTCMVSRMSVPPRVRWASEGSHSVAAWTDSLVTTDDHSHGHGIGHGHGHGQGHGHTALHIMSRCVCQCAHDRNADLIVCEAHTKTHIRTRTLIPGSCYLSTKVATVKKLNENYE